ncbi:MAG: phosphoglycolate phosphatase [Proteobacteria bacterium SW_6_67_9]|nr:MAG: phosphoglycolate phosphatase [Proteobacteria bacterium SW_6_67_9]
MLETDLVLFDLDGTLVDTAPDMANALNRVLTDQGEHELALATVRPHVSRGAAGLLALAFGHDLAPARHEALREALLHHYRADLARLSRPFPGMVALLDRLEARGVLWGVVTNKPAWLADPLLEQLDLARRCVCIVSGDTLAERKPAPAPLRHACTLAGASAARSLYVGDDERDVQAAHRAGMRVIVALFGYLGVDTTPAQWGATGLIETPGELWAYLEHPGAAEVS